MCHIHSNHCTCFRSFRAVPAVVQCWIPNPAWFLVQVRLHSSRQNSQHHQACAVERDLQQGSCTKSVHEVHQHQPMFKTLKWLKSVTCDIFCGFVFFGKSIEVSQNDKMFEKTKDVSETEAWPKCPEPCVPSCCALAAAPCSKCQNQQRLIGKQAEKESFQKKSEEMQKKQKMQTMRCESLKDEPWDTKTSLDDKGKSQNTALDNSVQVPHHWKLNLVSSQRSIWLQQLWNRCFVHSTCILKSKFRTAARPCSSKMNAPTPTPEPGIVQWTWTFSLRTFANLQCYITLYYTYSLIVSVF